jgi:hypothetical protein
MGCPYNAVGTQRASDSAIGLPSSSSSASWMVAFLIPAEVRRSFMSLSPGIRREGLRGSAIATQQRLADHRKLIGSGQIQVHFSADIPEHWRTPVHRYCRWLSG